MSMEAVMALAPKQSASSTVNKKLKTTRNIPHRIYYVHRKANIESCYEKKMWIGRTELPL
jgi:hypothetical protein